MDKRDNVTLDHPHFQLAGLQLSKVQYLCDQVQQLMTISFDDRYAFAQPGVRVLCDLIGRTEDGRQRRPEFVRNIGEKLGFHLIEHTQIPVFFLQFF